MYDDFELKIPFRLHGLHKKCIPLRVNAAKGILFVLFYSSNNPLTAKLFNLNFHPLEVVSR